MVLLLGASSPRCDPKMRSDDEFSFAGTGGRTFSSSRSVKRCSSSTLSSIQHDARDSACLRRAGGRRTFSSSLSMKRCSSSTLSRRYARCAEAGGSLDSFESSFVCGADPVTTRVQRVTDALYGHHNACGTNLSQNSYSVQGLWFWNSENSRGDTEVGDNTSVHMGKQSR